MNRWLKVGIVVAILCLVGSANGLHNPSAVYCEEMGYKFYVAETPTGQSGICELPDGSYVSAWWFLEGKVKTEYSYCAQQGYEIKTVSGELCDRTVINDECSVCIMPNGSEVEVSELMGLDFSELVCGDGVCGMTPENYTTCPQDCPPSASDAVCNTASGDGCDSDCEEGEDPDCNVVDEEVILVGERPAELDMGFIIIISVLFIVVLILAVAIAKRKKPH